MENIALIVAFICGLFIAPVAITFMTKLKFGSIERDNAVEAHIKKSGTPTVGGVIFIIPTLLIMLAYGIYKQNFDYLVLAAVLFLFGLVGFLDDYLKIKKHSKDGLKWYQKMGALFIVSAGFAAWMQFCTNDGSDVSFLILGKPTTISFGWLYIPFVIFVMLAMTNAVNLTDGLDGLCGGTSIIVLAFILCATRLLFVSKVVSTTSALLIGGLMAFLVVNYNPAKIFMGDTGSLALGGIIGALAIYVRHPFMIAFAGMLFVFEALSVILQVGFFKLTHGKRLFKCAPLHHHFEKCGWAEIKVTYVFWIFTIICSLITFLIMRG